MKSITYAVLIVVGLMITTETANAHHNGGCHYTTTRGGLTVYRCP